MDLRICSCQIWASGLDFSLRDVDADVPQGAQNNDDVQNAPHGIRRTEEAQTERHEPRQEFKREQCGKAIPWRKARLAQTRTQKDQEAHMLYGVPSIRSACTGARFTEELACPECSGVSGADVYNRRHGIYVCLRYLYTYN